MNICVDDPVGQNLNLVKKKTFFFKN